MRLMIFGAGVLGSLYGGRLAQAGHDVTVLARGRRLEDVRRHGIVLEDALSGERSAIAVPVVERLDPDERYDAIVVLVRRTQLDGALSVLAGHRATPAIVFMASNVRGPRPMADAVGAERVLLGFAGAGGTLDGTVVSYTKTPAWLQRTTFGEPDGACTPRVRSIAAAFGSAGFAVAVERHMDAWQKTHEAWVSPVAGAIYAAGGDPRRLARAPDAIALMVRAIHENLRVLRAAGVRITPPRLRALAWLPERVAARALPPVIASRWFDVVAARHANAARDEMKALGDDLAELAARAGVATPAAAELLAYADPALTARASDLPMT